MFRNVFVTVGTTVFDDLLNMLSDERFSNQLNIWSTEHVRIQAGSSKVLTPSTKIVNGVNFEVYEYKSSLDEDMDWADIVISHAGAGTTLDALDKGKTLFVVPNERLMENHQGEFATFLAKQGYAYSATYQNFFDELAKVRPGGLLPFPQASPDLFQNALLSTLGINVNDENSY